MGFFLQNFFGPKKKPLGFGKTQTAKEKNKATEKRKKKGLSFPPWGECFFAASKKIPSQDEKPRLGGSTLMA